MSIRFLTAAAFGLISMTATAASASVVSEWNAAALQEVRKSTALRNGPPIVARALAIVHTCIYDAWAAYDAVAIGTRLGDSLRQPPAERTAANTEKAISFAAYRCLRNLYPDAASAARLDAVLRNDPVDPHGAPCTPIGPGCERPRSGIGYTPDLLTMTPSSPVGVGNTAAQAVIDFRANDGANQYGDDSCTPLDPAASSKVCPSVPIEIFTPVVCTGPAPGQLVDAPLEVTPLPCVHPSGSGKRPYADYNAPAAGYTSYVPRNPLMGFCNPIEPVCPRPDAYIPAGAPYPNIIDVDHWQPLIFSSGSKQTFIGPYFTRVTPFALRSSDQFDHLRHLEPNILRSPGAYKRAADEVLAASAGLDDDQKLVVEYWADGPESELPPGHWGLFAQFVSRRDGNSAGEDAKMFFAMHNASMDAGIVAWHLKRKFDGVRPITAIRHLYEGKKVAAYGGPGRPVEEIDGEKWMPYNPGTNLTPPFPGYISGHSAFSAASAEVLKRFTGNDHFGFTTLIPAFTFNRVETPGIPVVDSIIEYGTFSDAANAAALSRLLGGIHFSEDNVTGLKLGRLIGREAWEKATHYFNGGRSRGSGHER